MSALAPAQPTDALPENKLPHVVIVGGGFGGLSAGKTLARLPVRVTLVDRRNHHLFQPLLYQVATAGLSPAEIAYPIRSIFRRQKNLTVLLSEVKGIDVGSRRIHLLDRALDYDYLILAVGADTNYFGHPEWSSDAVGLKDLDDAVEIRRRILLAFEAAEREEDPSRREALLTFVVVGGGPTGVELAGALSELSRFVLASDFRNIHPASAKVILVEAGPRLLAAFPPDLSAKAQAQLERLGVRVRQSARVQSITPDGVVIGSELIASKTVVWAAGVSASPITRMLGVPVDRQGRVGVEQDLSIPGHPEVFVIGDASSYVHQVGAEGNPLPGVSPVAIQEGRFVARAIRRDLRKAPRARFVYVDKGTLATIGRKAAVADIHGLHLSGVVAWVVWLVVHIFFLIGFRNRIAVLLDWLWSYVTYQRGSRLITGNRLQPGSPAALTEKSGAGAHTIDGATAAPEAPSAFGANQART